MLNRRRWEGNLVNSMRRGSIAAIGLAFLLAFVLAGCGSGSSSSPTPPPSTVSIAISPTSASVGYSATQQFTATVTGTSNTAVTWTVSSTSSSSSTEIGSVSSSGLYTAPAAATASPASGPTAFQVAAGGTASNINVAVQPLNDVSTVTVTATSAADSTQSASATVTLTGLSILAVGQCDLSTGTCSATGTGTEISRSQAQPVYLFVGGFGIVPGTTYSISGDGVVVTQPPSSNFQTATNGTPVVYFPVTVSPTASLGPRNLVVKNGGNEIAAFPGGVSITQ